jgi:hypothetical protein
MPRSLSKQVHVWLGMHGSDKASKQKHVEDGVSHIFSYGVEEEQLTAQIIHSFLDQAPLTFFPTKIHNKKEEPHAIALHYHRTSTYSLPRSWPSRAAISVLASPSQL